MRKFFAGLAVTLSLAAGVAVVSAENAPKTEQVVLAKDSAWNGT